MRKKSSKQKIRQFSISFQIVLLLLFLSSSILAQTDDTKTIDYSKKSNILNPDTLQGDQKKVFWHFVKLTHEEVKALTPLQIQDEFKELGIYSSERARFVAAYGFVRITMTHHKKSCEQWAYFESLKP